MSLAEDGLSNTVPGLGVTKFKNVINMIFGHTVSLIKLDLDVQQTLLFSYFWSFELDK